MDKKKALRYLFSGENIYSILFYVIVLYLIITYVAIPSVYAFSSVSYISAVVSGSMVHSYPSIQLTYYDWLQSHGYNMSQVSSWPFSGGIPIGSIAVAYKVQPPQIKIGDVIIYRATYNGVTEDIIHRVVNETIVNGTYYYTTKGDANPYSLPFEFNIPYDRVVGRVNSIIPYLGYPKYLFNTLANYI